MESDMEKTICERCGREWPDDSEQAASVRMYKQCIVCCVEMERTDNYSWSILDVKREQRRFVGR